jgi:hypothetical protein
VPNTPMLMLIAYTIHYAVQRYNAQVVLVRGFANGNCKPSDKLPGQSYAVTALLMKRTLQVLKYEGTTYSISVLQC